MEPHIDDGVVNSEIERLTTTIVVEYERMIGKLLKSVGVDTNATTENIKNQLNDRGYTLKENSSRGWWFPTGAITKHIQVVDANNVVVAEDTFVYKFSFRKE